MLAFSFCSEFMSTVELVTLAVELIVCAILLHSLFSIFAVLLAYLRYLFHHGYTYEIHCRHALPCVLGHNSFVALAHLKDILCYQARYDSGPPVVLFFVFTYVICNLQRSGNSSI